MRYQFRKILLGLLCLGSICVTLASCASLPANQEEYDAAYPTVKFGTFPQSAKAEDVTIDESEVVKVNGFDCYKGSDEKLYTAYNGKYFLMEDIEWYVLADKYEGGQLLIAKNALIAHNFYKSEEDRAVDGKTVLANNYKYSDLRAFLNGLDGSAYNVDNYTGKGFIDLAFSDEEKSKIITAKVDNSAKSTNDAGGNIGNSKYSCENTNDKIFVLSSEEVTTKKFGFDTYNHKFVRNDGVKYSSRLKYATDFAKETGVLDDDVYKAPWWWLRSPGLDRDAYANAGFSTKSTPFFSHAVDPAAYAYLMRNVTDDTVSVVPSIVLKVGK